MRRAGGNLVAALEVEDDRAPRLDTLDGKTVAQLWDFLFRGDDRSTLDSDTNVLEVAIRRLRAKIDDPFDLKLLHTVRGSGYVLEDRSWP